MRISNTFVHLILIEFKKHFKLVDHSKFGDQNGDVMDPGHYMSCDGERQDVMVM